MKFVLSLDVTESETTELMARRLEAIARALREQSTAETFVLDCERTGGAIKGFSVRGEWKLETGEPEWVCPMCEALGNSTHVPDMTCTKHYVPLVLR